MRNQITSFIESKGLLSSFQSGFRKGHSTTTTLAKVLDDISMNIDRGDVTLLVLVDFSKAFGSVPHLLLLEKLKNQFGFSSSACKLLGSYLNGRTQKVVINGRESKELFIIKGVPEGSILGPLLFSLFINDLPSRLWYIFKHLYADDLQLYDSEHPENFLLCIGRLNRALQDISNWARENLIKINVNKTHVIYFTNKKRFNVSHIPMLTFDDIDLPYETRVKNLGVTFGVDLRFREHVNSICSSIYHTLSHLWCSTKYLPTETRKRLVITLILPKITYCAPVYAGLSRESWGKLHRAWNACARYIFRKRKRDHISAFTNQILNCTLEDYISVFKCLFLFKIVHGNPPNYLKECISSLRSARTGALRIPLSHCNVRKSSLFVHGVSIWNSLSNATRNTSKYDEFKGLCFEELCFDDSN